MFMIFTHFVKIIFKVNDRNIFTDLNVDNGHKQNIGRYTSLLSQYNIHHIEFEFRYNLIPTY